MLTVPWLGRALAAGARALEGERGRPVFRGLLLAGPLLVGLGLLLASADPLFASLFRMNLDFWSVGFHISLVLVGALAVATLVRIEGTGEMPEKAPLDPPRPGSTEGLVVLAGLTALLVTFTATQVAAVLGAGRDVLVRDGTTYSAYARSGYFQLIAVVMITGTVLPLFRAVALEKERRSRWIRALCGAVVVLTLAVGIVAMRRLWLYNDAYGLTMLRLGSAVGAAWFGVLLLLLGASLMGVAPQKTWFPGAALITLLILIGVFAFLDPEAYIARYNVSHAQHARLDIAYLSTLSDDAMSYLSEATTTLDTATARSLQAAICARPNPTVPWSAWSLSRATASSAVHRLCTP